MDSAIHLLLNNRGQCGERQGGAKFLVVGNNVRARLEPRSSDLNLKVLNPQPPGLFVMEMEHLLKGKGERSKRMRQEKNKCNLSVGHPQYSSSTFTCYLCHAGHYKPDLSGRIVLKLLHSSFGYIPGVIPKHYFF